MEAYLDNAATTKVSTAVMEKMNQMIEEQFETYGSIFR